MNNIVNRYKISLLFFIAILLLGNNTSAQILVKKYSLNGYWNFSVGDYPQWKDASFIDAHWAELKVGQNWESQGYDDYNGIAWYRRKIIVNERPNNTLFIKIGAIDDADEVYFNGTLIGSTGGFPPNTKTAFREERNYEIPSALWKTGENVIAIRVYDLYLNGGIIGNPIGIYEDISDNYLALNLAGDWHFTSSNEKEYKEYKYNHSHWKNIKVPGRWEDQGWPELDGIAWYRKSFYLPDNLNKNMLYLTLGKIDDEDVVYLNGEKIGETFDKHTASWKQTAYRKTRIYKIPEGLLSSNNPNVIAVKVRDYQLDGGIYEGPIGLLTKEQAKKLDHTIESQKDFWESFWDWVNE
ncbi:beta galactosidase jelly roll domain-containing protein [Carboxylicivirga sp. N1Y90]|uniref:beta galactosidase jelly roll domain-containing protein n=1 Tax=Carboxylicivirga fragile TaxID=3417571 RepID=UPI003D345162|nr:beta galactosidase jelly roll domain-containing protein [Marinilabiliaceae bacterium N1Y90]